MSVAPSTRYRLATTLATSVLERTKYLVMGVHGARFQPGHKALVRAAVSGAQPAFHL